MNLEQWLQFRREGRLAAMPLGMQTAVGASGDEIVCNDKLENGYGNGHEHGYGYGDGWEYLDGDGDGDGDDGCGGDGYANGAGYANGNGASTGTGTGNVYRYEAGNSINSISRITQRFYEANP